MEDVPIDIHVSKLSEWLVSRRHVQHGWQSNLLKIREKINSALKDMPEHEQLKSLLTGSFLDYWHVLRIVEILKETEVDSKNLFGFYSSQRMKDWQEVQKLYEKENVYLAEAAQILSRTVNYEIPGTKKHVAKLQQLQEECEKKEAECQRNSDSLRDQYKSSCASIGITGERPKTELLALLDTLPDTFNKIADNCRTLSEARDFYGNFLDHTLGEHIKDDNLPVLRYIIQNGNTTVYQWRYGEAPVTIEENKIEIPADNIQVQTEDDSSGDIDFSTFDISSGDVEVVHLETGEIDWAGTEEADTIEWGGDAIEKVSEWSKDISVEAVGLEGGVARGAEALTLLDNVRTRNQFVDDLIELECFLTERMRESKEEDSVMSSLPSHLHISDTFISTMINNINSILTLINNVKMQQLYLIKSSPEYVDRLEDNLKHKLRMADKMLLNKDNFVERRKKSVDDVKLLLPQIERMSNNAKAIKKQIEDDISKRYKNRPVHLLGMNIS